MALAPGIHALDAAVYHADPAPEPSLSRSIAKLLIDASPAHAWAMHPRLGGAGHATADASDEMDVGSAAHAAFLRGLDAVTVIPFPTYQSKDAKAARDVARAAGKIPLKQHHYEKMLGLVDALEAFRAATGAFTRGQPEQTLIWQDEGHYARCMVDWLPDDPGAPLWDLKTTGGLATDEAWRRVAFGTGADLQAAHYGRGTEILRGEPPNGMRFCVIEQDPPHGIAVFALSPAGLEIGEAKAALARSIWTQCVASRAWPGYPHSIVPLDPPPWERMRWESQTQTGRALMTHEQRAAAREAFTEQLLAAGQLGA